MSHAATDSKQPVAEDLSRMEGEYGSKMLGKLKQMHVLIVGLTGLGVETAKNLILAGPHTVVVADDHPCQIQDMGSNFYIHPQHVQDKLSRSEASIKSLGELNPNVHVSTHTGPLTQAYVQQFDVVCVTDQTIPLQTLIQYNQWCRARQDSIKGTSAVVFIYSVISGVTANVFADFGPDHACFDDNGVPAKQIVIDHISKAKNGIVTIDGDRHLLNDGDLLKFEEVRGMNKDDQNVDPHSLHLPAAHAAASHEEVNPEKYVSVNDVITDINSLVEIKTTKNPKKFAIGDTTQLGDYVSGGIATQVKKIIHFHHKTLENQISAPQFISGYMDFTKFGRECQLHFARAAIFEFQARHNRLPAVHSQTDAQQVVDIAKELLAQHKTKSASDNSVLVVDEIEESVILNTALYAQTELSPLAALFGGVVAQEITKQTGKYTPITQWFHFDAFELLADKPPADGAPLQSRYDHQIAVFGKAVQDKIMSQKLFLVGCGALGCEYIKLFATTGLGLHGNIHITDDDRIELSNLSRQFLFRRKHVGQAKSISAAGAAKEMNPDIGKALTAMENRVEPKTEDIFNDRFWENLDFVVNALDNQIARKYVDSKCVTHLKPLFESGTLGTQANSVICLPHKTPSYSEGAVAGEDQGIAKCTLRNFPSEITHCIEWAREKFDDLFVSAADSVNSLLEDRKEFFAKLKQDPLSEADSLRTVRSWLDLCTSPSFETCIQVMFREFTANYRDAINDLTHHFPADARNRDRETGADLGPFWHGHKRFPTATEFDPNNEQHLDYIFHGSNILASVFGLKEQTRDQVKQLAAHLKAQPWVFSGAVVKLDEDKDKKKDEESKQAEPSLSDKDANDIADITSYLQSLDLTQYRKLNPADFEKDDDKNHHVDWLTASTNLRAFNYHIKLGSRQKVRMVAGRIIPAIATTTASITGFIGLEIYKYILQTPLEKYRACTINLATNIFCCENLPDPAFKKSGLDPATYMQIVAIPENHTIWDKVVIDKPDLTLQGLLAEFKSVHHNAEIDMLTSANGSGVVFYNGIDQYDPKKKAVSDERLKMKVVDLYTSLMGPIFPADRTFLLFDATVEDESGNPGFVPTIKYVFRK